MYSVDIYDANGGFIGELPAASAQDVMGYINKGFVVKNKITGNTITVEEVSAAIGVSDGFISI